MNRPLAWMRTLAIGCLWTSLAAAQDVQSADAPADTATPVADTASADTSEGDETSALDDMAADSLRELRTIEASVHTLKERVFRSKATLQLLRELVLERATMGSGVQIWHVDDLPKAYDVESIQYFLDGRNIYAWSDPDDTQEAPEELRIRDQSVAPGQHTIQVQLILRGNGGGLFGYVQQYRFKVQSSYSFDVEEGRLTTLRVRTRSKGGVRRAFVDRPTVVYEERVEASQVE